MKNTMFALMLCAVFGTPIFAVAAPNPDAPCGSDAVKTAMTNEVADWDVGEL